MESVRGNVDTRLRKLDEGQFDAILLASAGLRRLGLADRIVELLDPAAMCPAVGQGALAVETRDDGGEAEQICRRLDHAATSAAVTAERALLAELGGGCQTPIGAYAWQADGVLKLRGVVISPDGSRLVRKEGSGSSTDAAGLGAALGRELLEAGAQEILDAVYGESADAALRT